MPRFCAHNRLLANCPLCRTGTPLDPSFALREQAAKRSTGAVSRGRARSPGRRAPRPGAPSPGVRGRAAVAGLEDEAGQRYEVRLEAVPGGVRLAEWSGGTIRRRAPRLPVADLVRLGQELAATGALAGPLGERLAAASQRLAALAAQLAGAQAAGDDDRRAVVGASAGRAGDLRDELRVELFEDGTARVGRWVELPHRGFQLREAPVLMPIERLVEALERLADDR